MNAPEAAAPAGVPEGFQSFSPGDDFVSLIGPLFLKLEEDGPRLGLLIERRHSNPMGIAHGGVLMTLADMVMGVGCGFVTGIRFPHPTISMNSDFLRGPRIGTFVSGQARIARRTRNFLFCACELTDPQGEAYLTASGVFKSLDPDKLPPHVVRGKPWGQK
ncbi:MAG: PaaI family thioesterase [Reyranellaceae bacterium]